MNRSLWGGQSREDHHRQTEVTEAEASRGRTCGDFQAWISKEGTCEEVELGNPRRNRMSQMGKDFQRLAMEFGHDLLA